MLPARRPTTIATHSMVRLSATEEGLCGIRSAWGRILETVAASVKQGRDWKWLESNMLLPMPSLVIWQGSLGGVLWERPAPDSALGELLKRCMKERCGWGLTVGSWPFVHLVIVYQLSQSCMDRTQALARLGRFLQTIEMSHVFIFNRDTRNYSVNVSTLLFRKSSATTPYSHSTVNHLDNCSL